MALTTLSDTDYRVGYAIQTNGKNTIVPAIALADATGSALAGRKAASSSLSVVPAAVSPAAIAASQTDSIPGGGSGAANDYLSHIVIQPATTAAGSVVVKDGTTVLYTFTSGTLSDLKPITVPFGAFCATAWKITTGTNVAVLACGNFT